MSRIKRSWSSTACRDGGSASTAALFRTILRGRRRLLCRRRINFLLQILGHLLLRGLQIVDDLLQRDEARFHALDLPVGGAAFLLMVHGELRNLLLQEDDID